MRQYFSIMVMFTLIMLAIPAFSLFVRKPSEEASVQYTPPVINAEEIIKATVVHSEAPEEEPTDIFLVLDIESGKVLSVSARDYVIGAVCAEMPASFHKEALKAQAVAAHTYAVRQREKEKLSPTKELKGAYFSNDSRYYQAYFTEEQAKKFYGEAYEENHAKIAEAVDEVLDEIIVYDNEPIIAAFHSMSGGKTESARVVWGNDVEYLVPVDSSSDSEIESFEEAYVFTPEEIKARITTAHKDIKLTGDETKWFSVTDRSPSGTVTAMSAGDGLLTGNEFREALSLRSANFTVSYDGENFNIVTKGFGHGVGLSQYGANSMALDGSGYKEILAHYYPETEIITEK